MPVYSYHNPYEQQSGTIESHQIAEAGFVERQHQTGSITLNYVAGPNNGMPLVLIPAQMGTWESYSRVLIGLSKHFTVYAVDVRGHGKSTWTPGDYSWRSIGEDMRSFLTNVVGRPAIVSGNSSGGIIALWCAVNVPEYVAGLVLEDAPVFSAEMPRFKEKDRFVYNGLVHAVTTLGDLQHRDLANYFRGLELPISETRTKRIPDVMINFLSKRIRQAAAKRPGKPIELRQWYIPHTLRLLFKSLSMFDPDFARAFVDGRIYNGLDHAKALQRIKCPILLLHADWHRYPAHGLVGAMDDTDAARIRKLAPQTQYQKVSANHVIHIYKPRAFEAALTHFLGTIN